MLLLLYTKKQKCGHTHIFHGEELTHCLDIVGLVIGPMIQAIDLDKGLLNFLLCNNILDQAFFLSFSQFFTSIVAFKLLKVMLQTVCVN